MSDVRTCPQCGRTYGGDDRFCTVDGAALVASGSASLIGTVVADRFLVHEKLGEGGMGEVYLAEHVRIKRKVALKLMRRWMIGDPVSVGRFHREAENASQISHANVAQVYDFGETADGLVYLAMEYVEGEPLSRVLEREGALHTVRTAEIVRQVGEALVAAHGMGILHRDLKPDNVMVGKTKFGTDAVKLVDFGIARAMGRTTQQFTSTGMIVGTPDYMSPEQLSGDALDGRSDLYALALIAFRMLTGIGAYPDGATGDALLARLTSPPKRLRFAREGIDWPMSLQAAFDRALSADPNDRFADPMEFVAELDAAVQEMPLGEVEESYLLALHQRHATPVRGGPVLDAATPSRGIGNVRSSSPVSQKVVPELTPVPPAPTVGGALLTPPEMNPEVLLGRSPRDVAAGVTQPMTTAASSQDEKVASDLVPPVGERARSTLTLRTPAVVGAGLAAVAAAVFAIKSFSAARNNRTDDTGPAAAVSSLASAPGATPPDTMAARQLAPDAAETPASFESVIARARRATVAVHSANGRGVATIVDQAGTALTSLALVPADGAVDLWLDDATRVQGVVARVDSASGLAALVVPMSHCAQCEPLAFAVTDVRAADSIVALLFDGRVDAGDVRGTVTEVEAAALAISVPTARLQPGTPIVSRAGHLVTVVARRRIPSSTIARDLAVAARGANVVAATQLLPSWPSAAVPSNVISAAQGGIPAAIRSKYKATQNELALVVMTPQVIVWRDRKSSNSGDAAPAIADPFKIDGPAVEEKTATSQAAGDPIGRWPLWRRLVRERRAVVVVSASAARAAFPDFPTSPQALRAGNVRTLRLLRNDQLVTPIDSGRYDSGRSFRSRPSEPFMAAVAVYSPDDFADTTATYVVEVDDAKQPAPVRFPLAPALLKQISADFSWRKP